MTLGLRVNMTPAQVCQAVDDHMRRKDEISRKQRLEDWGAICPNCGTDVLDELEASANDWEGYGPPSSVEFECPNCRLELQFDLEWSTMLYSASIV